MKNFELVYETVEWRLWLTSILYERFGVNFDLAQRNKNFYITLPGSEKFLEVGPINNELYTIGSRIQLVEWSIQYERFARGSSSIFVPKPASGHQPLMVEKSGSWYVNFDFIGFIYWMLSRVEEVDADHTDRYGRFKSNDSIAVKLGFWKRPVVDELLHFFGSLVKAVWPEIELSKKEFVVLPTHDIDRINVVGPTQLSDFSALVNGGRAIALDIVKRNYIFWGSPIYDVLKFWRLNSDGLNTIDWLMQKSEFYGLKSTFHFLFGLTSICKDGSYNVDNPQMKIVLQEIIKRSHLVGLHPSFKTSDNLKRLEKEVRGYDRLVVATGNCNGPLVSRMHYLKWSHPLTLNLLEKVGINVDNTLGFSDRIGFRCGTSHEYPAFDPVSVRRINVRIRPLIAMDASFLRQQHLSAECEANLTEDLLKIKSRCKDYNGIFSLLWHNSELFTEQRRRMYLQLISS